MADAAEKGSTERAGELDVAYVGQGEGAAQHRLLLLGHFLMRGAAGRRQQSCQSEKCDGTTL